MGHENCKQVEIPASTTAAIGVDNLCTVSSCLISLTALLSAIYIEGRAASLSQHHALAYIVEFLFKLLWILR
jgi:hypothetical protein